jgi:hypothetical protein
MKQVNFDLTLSLISIGFNEKCNAIFINDSDEIKIKYLDIEFGVNNDDIGFAVIAPTYYDAFKWFRTKHGLHYVPTPKFHFPDNGINDIYHYEIFNSRGDEVGFDDGTYIIDESLEVKAIERLIEIVKELKNG